MWGRSIPQCLWPRFQKKRRSKKMPCWLRSVWHSIFRPDILTIQENRSKKIPRNGNTAGFSRLGQWGMLISRLSDTCGKSVFNSMIDDIDCWRKINFSTARIFLGRSAVMAKALGSTIEEEHREGLHKLAKACFVYNLKFTLVCWLSSKLANKRPSWLIFYWHRAAGGLGVVWRLSATRLCTIRKYRKSDSNPPRRACHANSFRSPRTFPS